MALSNEPTQTSPKHAKSSLNPPLSNSEIRKNVTDCSVVSELNSPLFVFSFYSIYQRPMKTSSLSSQMIMFILCGPSHTKCKCRR